MSIVMKAGLIAGAIYITALTYYIRRLLKDPDSV